MAAVAKKPPLLPALGLIRSLSTASTAAAATAPQPSSHVLDLDDTERLFSSTPTRSLLASLANLYLIALDPVVDLGTAVMRSKAMQREDGGLVRAAVLAVLKRTVYAHFCAGEDLDEASRTLRGLWEDGLRGILDYGLEDADDDAACDGNLVEFLRTVETTARLPPSSVSFACVKITAICPISLLEKLSHHLRWCHRHGLPSAGEGYDYPSLPVLAHNSPLHYTPTEPLPLSPSDARRLEAAQSRLHALCSRCADAGLPLLVDAEYTSVQPAIDHLTFAAMRRFNAAGPDDRPLVYGTIQTYLRDARERLAAAVGAAGKEGVPVGFKLVRGAYMSREAREAAVLGAESPIHKTIGETHECYDQCASFLLDRVASRGSSTAMVLATHNLESGKAAAGRAVELGIEKGDWRVQFAQLKGMAEGLSMGLRNGGFNVSKYLAFGPVGKVLPYLMRRAEENRGVLSASTLDRQLMRMELMRRIKTTLSGK